MPDFDAQAMKRDDGREEVWRVASATSEDHARQIAVAVASREGGQHLVGRIEPALSKSPARRTPSDTQACDRSSRRVGDEVVDRCRLAGF